MERWKGKTAVVTGAGSGIGSAIYDKLTESGVRVVGIDVKWNHEKAISKNCLKCDVTNVPELAETFKQIEEQYGGVDIMVNCAGCAKKGQITSIGTSSLSDAEVSLIFDVNTKAMIYCTRFAVDSMKKRGFDGHIVNINSIAGHYVPLSDNFNLYTSSKHAVTAFTKSLTRELATFKSKIKTTSISPGLVKTPMTVESLVENFSTVPHLLPSDVADTVLYALSTPPHVNITELTVQPVAEMLL